MRLADWDYTQPGAYSVTIVTHGRACLFGTVMDEEMRLNPAGEMIRKWWYKLPEKFTNSQMDEHVVMPNHVHGIIWIPESPVGADPGVGPGVAMSKGAHIGAPLHGVSIPKIIQWFKTMTTNEYIRGVKQLGWQSFSQKLWQRSFYDHIIRDERGLHQIREYIRANPMMWDQDGENPVRGRM
jgi:putative transposase